MSLYGVTRFQNKRSSAARERRPDLGKGANPWASDEVKAALAAAKAKAVAPKKG